MLDIPSILIGNPENRRVSLFQKALHDKGLPPAEVIPYLSILDKSVSLSDFIKPNSLIRVESPGENFEVEKQIISLGEQVSNTSIKHSMSLKDNYGEIRFPSLWFSGFTSLMNSIQEEVEKISNTHLWYNYPEDIITMFDKNRTKKLLKAKGIPTTSIHPQLSSYDEFRDYIEKEKLSRLFIKLNNSSSASGVVAYEYNRRKSHEQAYSTIEIERTNGINRFFNSLKIKKYTDREAIKTILNFLFSEGALIEKWIPKATHERMAYDLRILAINKKACQSIGRLSRSPMTNLHLGNRRVNPEDLNINEEMWEEVYSTVQKTMEVFPHSLYAGLDIIIPKESKQPVVLEVNAFGDLLPNILFEGTDSYGSEIDAQIRRLKSNFV